MASELKVDKFTGVTTAGSILVTGEGNSTTTSLHQGLAKAWVKFNGTGTITARDSLNVGSLTDHGTGSYTVTLSNNMANASYSITMMTSNDAVRQFVLADSDTTSSFRVGSQGSGGSQADTSYIYTTVPGDLA